MSVNESLGAWSALFMLLAAMTYLVAFVAFDFLFNYFDTLPATVPVAVVLVADRPVAAAGEAQSITLAPAAGGAVEGTGNAAAACGDCAVHAAGRAIASAATRVSAVKKVRQPSRTSAGATRAMPRP